MRTLWIVVLVFLPVVTMGQWREETGSKLPYTLTGDLRLDLRAGFEHEWLADSINRQNSFEEHKKSPLRAALYSAVIPGAGEFYSEQYWKAGGFLAAEVTLWIVYAVYTSKGDDQTALFEQYADAHWSVVRYAEWIEQYSTQLNPDAQGCSGLVNGGSNLPPWERVDWTRLNACEEEIGKKSGNGFTHRLPRRPEQQYYELIGKYPQYAGGWDDANVTPQDILVDNVSARFHEYSAMRGKANDFFNIASTTASVLVVNHVLSALDAAWSAAKFNQELKVEAHLKPTLRPYGFVEFVPTASLTLKF